MGVKVRNIGGIKPQKGRFRFVFILLICAAAVFLGRLVRLQLSGSTDVPETASTQYKNTVDVAIPTIRGEICDVNGVPLVTNVVYHDLVYDTAYVPTGKDNSSALETLRLLEKNGIAFEDLLPVTSFAPYELIRNYADNEDAVRLVRNFSKYYGLDEAELVGSPDALYLQLLKTYKLKNSDFTDPEKRLIAGFRFTVDSWYYTHATPCPIITHVEDDLMNRIADTLHDHPALAVTVKADRYYNEDSSAAHLLGRIGPIYADEAEEYRNKGYNLGDDVGKTGAEAAFEEQLHGADGTKTLCFNDPGDTLLTEVIKKAPVSGKTVKLTIDIEMQKAAERSLERVIKSEARYGLASGMAKNGADACAGSVVVMNVADGGLPVLASYPSYSQNNYEEDIEALLHDDNSPLLNRATQGIYEPGSTYKIATAAAGLYYGTITPTTSIYDKGEFEDYPTYKPHCWIYDRYGVTHGYQDVRSAIENSCNYFFFRIGKEMGIAKMNDYAKVLGLGVPTGIEIGESTGVTASPEYKESVGLSWNPGDTLQAAIGQQHLFTPVQLASYLTTVLNGGVRYKAHLFHSCTDYATGSITEVYHKEVLSEADIAPETVTLLKEAMRRVVDEGTASSVFENYRYQVGGKTGTAQVSKGSDNVVFVGFAPFDKPEIVVAVVLEHGNRSNNAAQVARDMFDCYFSLKEKRAKEAADAVEAAVAAANASGEADTNAPETDENAEGSPSGVSGDYDGEYGFAVFAGQQEIMD